MYLTVKGLVLRVTPYKDTDALLTILTADQGQLTVKARGLRRKNSPLVAACQLLAFGEFILFSYRDMYTINEAHALALFPNLRKDLVKLSLGTYMAQVAEVISQEDAPSSELLSLTLNCLYGLSELDVPRQQVKAVFELRVACLAGYAPNLDGCHKCGNVFPNRFDVSAGQLECFKCRDPESNGIRMPATGGVLESMRFTCHCDSKIMLSFRTSVETMEAFSQITELYLTTQLERGFSTLDFYKSLL